MAQYIIPAFTAVIVAVVEAIAARDRKESKKMQERRAREQALSMTMIDATLKLSVVSANALTNGHNNGNVEIARKAAEKAQAEYEAFLREVTATEICK